jgi:hypothetical protein
MNIYMKSIIGKYTIQIRGKRWYWPIFTRIVDMALTNAWILYRAMHGSQAINCLDFRRAVALSYLKKKIQPNKTEDPRCRSGS